MADERGEGLFGGPAAGAERADVPLPVRMRPTTLDGVVGQRHVLGPGTPLRRLVEDDAPMALLLWGPPGTGKTTLAYVLSNATRRRFVELSAVTAGVKDVRAVIEESRRELASGGRSTVLFIDEVHRFSKTQQDALLPAVENRWVTFIGATTENPFFAIISPLLSRALLLTLEPLSDEEMARVVDEALGAGHGLAGSVRLLPDAREHLLRLAGGDARRVLTYLEAAAGAAVGGATEAGPEGGPEAGPGDHPARPAEVSVEVLERAVDRAAVRYDREGDQHYDVASALIKSIRGSDVDAALHYLARMVEAGEDPRFIARRLTILASEDVGMADPNALQVAVAAMQAVQLVGLPEARLNLAQATIHLALAPKSNSVITAIEAASADVRAGLAGAVPTHLRDAHYPQARRLGHGRGYQYPHEFDGGIVAQRYAPEEVAGREYFRPGPHGAERRVGELLQEIRSRLRGAHR